MFERDGGIAIDGLDQRVKMAELLKENEDRSRINVEGGEEGRKGKRRSSNKFSHQSTHPMSLAFFSHGAEDGADMIG